MALDRRADVVVPIALAVKGGQLAHELSAYKNSSSAEARARLRVGLAAVLWRWLALHEECMAQAVGVESFPIVTTVPSTSGRTDEPVQDMVERIVGVTRDRYQSVLVANKGLPAAREARPDLYTTSRAFSGEAVLLIDDTWTTGAHAQSAAAALKHAGAGAVAVAVVGRHFSTRQPDPYRKPAEEYLKAARTNGWDWGRCRLDG
jgi:vacuolar-type H+-ATPase subunit F/Vma7